MEMIEEISDSHGGEIGPADRLVLSLSNVIQNLQGRTALAFPDKGSKKSFEFVKVYIDMHSTVVITSASGFVGWSSLILDIVKAKYIWRPSTVWICFAFALINVSSAEWSVQTYWDLQ